LNQFKSSRFLFGTKTRQELQNFNIFQVEKAKEPTKDRDIAVDVRCEMEDHAEPSVQGRDVKICEFIGRFWRSLEVEVEVRLVLRLDVGFRCKETEMEMEREGKGEGRGIEEERERVVFKWVMGIRRSSTSHVLLTDHGKIILIREFEQGLLFIL
jgi:hypothetical protein